jgi:predicted secreted protein
MPIGSIIAIYLVTWWLCLFVILPLGARSQTDAGKIVPGSEPGAPALLRLWPKVLGTTVLAGIVTAAIFWGLSNPLLREYWR